MGNQFCMDDGSDNPGVDIVLDANQHLDLDYNHNTLYYHFMDTDMDNIHTLRRNAYYADDESSEDSRDRHRPRPVDPYGGRPMTFVGGGNQRETKVVITKSQRVFVRPPPAKRERIERIRRERMVVVDDD
ncbi:hypothetical protein H2202_004903 [Exophiala xenobiotica]|nr:hypothetical protein H2202_004903 [Exophiala xenobiotica]